MSKLNDHEIPALDAIRHGGKSALSCKTPRRAACNGIVFYRQRGVVVEEGAPSCCPVIVAFRSHGGIACEKDGWGCEDPG